MLKKLFLASFVFSLFLPVAARAALTGVTITGSCSSTGPVAGARDMDMMVTSLTEQIKKFTKDIVKAIEEATTAKQAADEKNTATKAEIDNKRMAAEEEAKAEGRAAEKLTQETPVDPCIKGLGYYFNKDAEAINKAISIATAHQRNLGGGITENMKGRDQALGALAKEFDKNGFLFADLTYTPEQGKAAGAAIELLMPEWKNPRPSQFDSAQEEARYTIAEAKAKTYRAILSAPLYQFIFERAPYNPVKEIYQYMGPNSSAFTTTTFQTDDKGMVDLKQPPAVENIGEDGKVSVLARNDAVFQHFSNTDWLANLDSKLAGGVLKELLRLDAYSYSMLNDIRNSLQMGNVLLSLGILERYERLNKGVEATLVN